MDDVTQSVTVQTGSICNKYLIIISRFNIFCLQQRFLRWSLACRQEFKEAMACEQYVLICARSHGTADHSFRGSIVSVIEYDVIVRISFQIIGIDTERWCAD